MQQTYLTIMLMSRVPPSPSELRLLEEAGFSLADLRVDSKKCRWHIFSSVEDRRNCSDLLENLEENFMVIEEFFKKRSGLSVN